MEMHAREKRRARTETQFKRKGKITKTENPENSKKK